MSWLRDIAINVIGTLISTAILAVLIHPSLKTIDRWVRYVRHSMRHVVFAGVSFIENALSADVLFSKPAVAPAPSTIRRRPFRSTRIYGFEGVGWFITTLVIALGGYMVMAQGAFARANLHKLENKIESTQSEIRRLDTEFATRTNFHQLEKWNSENYKMAVPTAEQFCPNLKCVQDNADDINRRIDRRRRKTPLRVPNGS